MKKTTCLLLAALAAAAWLWILLFPSPQKIIRTRLAGLARDVSFTSNQTPLAGSAAIHSLANLFSTNAELHLDFPGRSAQTIAGREEIMQAAAGAHATLEALQVDFPDVNVTLAPGKKSATAVLDAKVQVSGADDLDVEEFKCTLNKIDGQWLITRVETLRAGS